MTIVEMLRQSAEKSPAKAAIIYKETQIAYGELLARARALASFLANIGFKKGERIGLLVEKTPEAIIAFLGAAGAGGIVFPIDPNQLPADLQFLLDLTHPSALIVASRFQSILTGLRAPCPDQRVVVIGERIRSHYAAWDDVVNRDCPRFPDLKIEDDDITYLNLTSGTTGTPKGAITTHDNIYWNTLSAVQAMRLTSNDIHVCMFPVFAHPHELFARPLFLGGSLVLVEGISPKAIAKAICDNGVTAMMAVVSIYASLAKLDRAHFPDLGALRLAESGGMHIPPATAQAFLERFGIPITPVWGSTETTGIALAQPWDVPYKPGSVGKPCPNYSVKLMDEERKEVGTNEVGELIVSGPGVCSSYYRDPAETALHMKDGWMFTGDLFKKDEEGRFYFAGRRSGMMKVAGVKVFPSEIEDVVGSHPDVAEVAVVKVVDPSHGEAPKAVVALKPGAKASASDIVKFCEKRLARYKVPRIIEFTKELPKSPGGKILYRKL